MVSKVARGTFLLILAVLVVSWAMSVGKSSPVDPQSDQPVERWYMYS